MSVYLSYFTNWSYQKNPHFVYHWNAAHLQCKAAGKAKKKSVFQLKLWNEFHVGKTLISKLEVGLDTRANTKAFIKCWATLNDYKLTSWPHFSLSAADFHHRRLEVWYPTCPPSATCDMGWEPMPRQAPGTVPKPETFRFPFCVINVHSWKDISFLRDRSYADQWQISLRGQRRLRIRLWLFL